MVLLPNSTCLPWATSRGTRSTACRISSPTPESGRCPTRAWASSPGIGRSEPDDVDFGEQFRVLFITSTRNASSSVIDDYNQHAINDAGAGHSAIRAYKDGFRVIASTATVNARDNAALTGTGVEIYWLDGATKVADDYADLFDRSWDSVSPFDRAGNSSSKDVIWTGSTDAGVAHGSNALGSATVEVGGTRTGIRPLSGGNASPGALAPLYAISQVLMVAEQVTRERNPSGSLHQPRVRAKATPTGSARRSSSPSYSPSRWSCAVFRRCRWNSTPGPCAHATTQVREPTRCFLPTRYRQAITRKAGAGLFPGAALFIAPGGSFMALDGASVRALADGSPALLVSG